MAVRSRKFGSFYRRECGHRVQNARRSDGGNPVGTRGLLYNIKHSCTPSKERRITRWEHEHVLEAVQRRLDELHLMRFAQTITRCGLAAATKSLAIECAKAGIRVNPVAASRTTGVVLRGTESLLTHRWREMDSKFQFRDASPPPTAWAPSFRRWGRLPEPRKQLCRLPSPTTGRMIPPRRRRSAQPG
jgi:NAD(P)-dependent dehydrogenase (short-subunit alcohol dehydrogenase family)